ncbi:RagB/SusD family nutrient uptake outer membrane protein [Mucilaginibacter sp. SJ]|uniref:RagB/SusD family nutrient uptake outer membrane protein n=1 Tax=Mucilaginibacter sp. SJ TaxID=3029053 RepID=UPI0023A94D7B|nr:RagB/SusD family nutrient uptake outer membrane protein [Mucilaginibacter sp. SJ]WEA00587.1 RagB/SusD family nutrient uptake outer membrane protein [Mucilaginibacter sp. SJ]
MSIYIRNLFLLIIITSIVSCTKLIEIPASAPNQLSQLAQFADSATTMNAVAAVYTYATQQQPNVFAFASSAFATSTGLSSDELLTSSSSQTNLQFYSYSLTPANANVGTLWSASYQGLYTINAVIENVNTSQGLSASFKQQITGEMKVVRALYYFNLVNLFGPVPLVSSTNYKSNASLSRAPVDSIYSFIIADLKDAKKVLKPAYPSSGHLRPNLYTAEALLSKVYLYRQQWQDAYNEASTVINSKVYKLTTLPNVFLDGNSEAIWQILATNPNTYSATAEAAAFVPYYSPTPTYVLTPFLLKAFEPNDQRFNNWVGLSVIGKDSLYYPYKYKNVVPGATTEDCMIVRLAEVYLIRAEASVNLGSGSDALGDLNVVRKRAGLNGSTADPASKTAVMNAIMHERQVEMFTEWSARWFDLKRWGLAESILGTEKSGWQAFAALYPVPAPEIQNNVNLNQNSGY